MIAQPNQFDDDESDDPLNDTPKHGTGKWPGTNIDMNLVAKCVADFIASIQSPRERPEDDADD